MKHLSFDEIIGFVSLTELNDEAIENSAVVNGHIRKCKECLEKVRAFQMIYDEFSQLGLNIAFEKYIEDNFSKMQDTESRTEIDEFDDLR